MSEEEKKKKEMWGKYVEKSGKKCEAQV